MVQTQITQKLLILALITVALSSCGTSKSGPQNTTQLSLNTAKPLARCQKVKDANFSINSSIVVNNQGQTSPDWIKLKFNFLSSASTQAGNTVRFFKWRVVNGQSQLDNAPLPFVIYNISTGAIAGTSVTSIETSLLTAQMGFYIQLNDPNAQFQVLKLVVYDSSGNIVAQMNSLIPEFLAHPTDYQYNPDGTVRAANLQQMHPLYGQDISTWTSAQISQHFDSQCF